MLRIREVKSGSKKIAIQAFYYSNRKRIIVKHFGSSSIDVELDKLRLIAIEFVKEYAGQLSIFPNENPNTYLLVDYSQCIGFYYSFFYSTIQKLMKEIGFVDLSIKLLLDLVVIRILEPASKLRSIELLETYFGIVHRRQSYYREAKRCLILKEQIQKTVLSFAKNTYSFDYSLLFYDVTTLYFETFESDELRKTGFSKDSKSQQPQILVALMVNKEGLPISFDIFPGNIFEGHTIIPVIKSFIRQNNVKHFTVVADAAMISSENIKELKKEKINYIVGARLGNLSTEVFEKIDTLLTRKDKNSIRIETDKGYLICSYSTTRYRKDKYEMDKQLLKAQNIIGSPSKHKKAKFVKANNEQLELNQNLIIRAEKLLGLKGYYTDIDESILKSNEVIERYHELYKIEQAFRIAKSDLQTRPIFHFKEEPIKLHILICFMALVISKHIELATNVSIKRFITECKKITDARMINTITQKEIIIKGKITEVVNAYLDKLNLSH